MKGRSPTICWTALWCAAVVLPAAHCGAAQVDIHGPPGSVLFGNAVSVLSNGNIVVTDPHASAGALSRAGAVHVYSPAGTLISTLSGSSSDDEVGGGGLVVLPSGDVIALSPHWKNAGSTAAGAATWINGETGLSGAVSPANSLVGSHTNDQVGSNVTILANGNYVVASPYWSDGAKTSVGAVTWVSGGAAPTGPVTSANSFVGSGAYEVVGERGVTALVNGDYVIASPGWSNGTNKQTVGAATWADGTTGRTGRASPYNSLIGASENDAVSVGGIAALANGNYVVASPNWDNGSTHDVGAVTWIDAHGAKTGTVSSSNSLTGKTAGDQVGLGGTESYWMHGVFPLGNGNYVVASSNWNNGLLAEAGAVTWCDGTTGRTGKVSTTNSLVGTSSNEHVGSHGIFPLSNGNYVVASNYWQNGSGAATWADGSTVLTGSISTANSLVGSTGGDYHDGVGETAVVALTNGNYVVPVPFWSNQGSDYGIGAAQWGDGAAGTSGVLSASTALTGDIGYGFVGLYIAALGAGNYVVVSPGWTDVASGAWQAGAVRRSFGGGGISGKNSSLNAFTGRQTIDGIGWGGVVVFADGNYAIISPRWQDETGTCGGAVTLISATSKPRGSPQPYNSVTCAGSVEKSAIGYDPLRRRMAVGRSWQQGISLLTLDDVFSDNLE